MSWERLAELRAALKKLPPAHYNTLSYLMAHLHRFLCNHYSYLIHSYNNRLSFKQLHQTLFKLYHIYAANLCVGAQFNYTLGITNLLCGDNGHEFPGHSPTKKCH